MNNVIVLLHGSGNGSYSWRRVQRALTSLGADVFAPDMLGYGKAPAPGAGCTCDEDDIDRSGRGKRSARARGRVGYAEMKEQYERFMSSLPDQTDAARVFVEHWSGKGVWKSIGERVRSVITSPGQRT